MSNTYDVAILGAGPGGYVAAIRAAQLGHSVCLIENEKLGGVCLNQGCIPTKTLVKSAEFLEELKQSSRIGINIKEYALDFSVLQKRKQEVTGKLRKGIEFILKKNNVELIMGEGRFVDQNNISVNDQKITFKNCIVATGSSPINLKGFTINEEGILSNQGILNLAVLPKSLLIIGGGVIGCEFAYIMANFGVKVTIVDIAKQLLPEEDSEAVQQLTLDFKKKGIKVLTDLRVESLEKNNEGTFIAKLSSGKDLESEKVLLSVGRKPNIEALSLEKAGIAVENGHIVVDEHMRTNVENIFAVGDVTGKTYLAHAASAQGIIAVENISLKQTKMNYEVIPRCVYTGLQIASVGLRQKEALQKNINIKVGKFPLSASGKAFLENHTQGFIKVILDAESKLILGACICGKNATELIGQFVVAMCARMTNEEFASVIQPHPTLSEALKEASEAAMGQAIHIVNT